MAEIINAQSFFDNRRKQILDCYNQYPVIQKSDQDIDFEKGGEGSRGGKVIGHTKSGKPIYENHPADHADYSNFTHHDHFDAYVAHTSSAEKHIDEDSEDLSPKNTKHDKERHNHHTQTSYSHLDKEKELKKRTDKRFKKSEEELDIEKGGVGSGRRGRSICIRKL